MELDYNGELTSDVSLDEVLNYLEKLPDDPEAFIILQRGDEQVYMQSVFNGEGFLVEYREGSEDKHFSSARTDLSLAQVKEIYTLYYNNDDSFKHKIKFKSGYSGASAGCLGLILILPVIVLQLIK